MLGNLKSRLLSKVPLLALALCLFVAGAVVVVHGATTRDAAPRSERSLPQPTGSATPSETPTPTASPTAVSSASASASARLDQAVAGRSAALEQLAAKAQQLSTKKRTARPVAQVTFAQFNVQGASHRGNVNGRTAIARDLLNRYHAGVAALQEFTASQQGDFNRLTGGAWGCYPCGSGPKKLDGENSVVWRKDLYTLLKVETRPYPYFFGAIRNMPRVLLRDRLSGTSFYVTSYHNPADVHGPAGGYRAAAVGRQIVDANALRSATKVPLIVSGDMNDRGTYFCRMAAGTGMHSADGSTSSGGCRVAARPWIDWIMGTPDVAFSGYLRDNSPTVRRSSDHPILITQVKITGQPGEGKLGTRHNQG